MKFDYVFKHLDHSDAVVENLREHLNKLDKEIFKPEKVHACFSKVRHEFCAELTMKTRDGLFKAKGKSDSLYAAIGDAVDKLDKQYLKKRKKAKNFRHNYNEQKPDEVSPEWHEYYDYKRPA